MSFESSSLRGRLQNAAIGQLFQALSREDSEEVWFFLTALAVEQRLGWSVLRDLGLPQRTWEAWLTRGFIERAGDFKPLSLLKDGTIEPAYQLSDGLRWRVLRHAHALQILSRASLATEALLQTRSQAPLVRKLMAGSLIFRPSAPAELDPSVRDCLHASVLEPFEPTFLTSTWKSRTPQVVGLVLRACLTDLRPCAALFEWAIEQVDLRLDPMLGELLISAGLHRLEQDRVLPALMTLESPNRTGLLAVSHFIRGDITLARRLLSQDLEAHEGKFPSRHPFTPLLALLVATSGSEKNGRNSPLDFLKTRGSSASEKSIHRALRTFVQTRDEPAERLRRLDPHRLKADAPAWEVLLLGLTAFAYLESESLRAAWADCLSRRGAAALANGYYWMGRQYLVLAAGLDRVQMERALRDRPGTESLPITQAALLPQPGDLAELVKVRAAWEVRLAALDRVTKLFTAPHHQHQLRFFVDAISGSIHRPGLLRHEPGRGWSLDRRLSWEEACALDDLGPEDQAVLSCTDRALENTDFPHLEVFERLIGHPRVVEGSAGSRPLEIVREKCRVETSSDAEHLCVAIHPAGVGPGLNLVRLGESRLAIVHVDVSMATVLEALPGELRVPQTEATRVLEVLTRLGETVPIVSPELDATSEEAADSTPMVRFTPHSGAYLVDVGLKPFGAEGRFFAPDTGPAVLTLLRKGRKVRLARDFEAESLSVSTLISASATLVGTQPEAIPHTDQPSRGFILGEEEVLTLLSELQKSGLTFHLEWPEKSPLVFAGSVSVGALRGGLRSQKGWYLLSGSINIDEARSLTVGELSRLPFVHRGRYIRLKNGDYAAVDRKVRALASLLSTSRLGPNGAVQLSPARLFSIRAALEGAAVDLDADIEQELQRIQQVQAAESTVPTALHAELRPYQEDGFRWLHRLGQLGFGALLADDMGLGKTIQIIAYLLTRPSGSRHLVVAPLSVCTNWLREVRRFAPGLPVHQFGAPTGLDEACSSKSETSEVTILSYSQLSAAQDALTRVEWDTITVDEAQYIKNPKTQRAQAILSLRARQRLATTGTPVENHLGDLWGIFRFLNPDLLGRWSAFHAHFVKPIERDDDAKQRQTLQQIVRPFILRRTKAQVLTELPPLTVIRHEVHLSEDETKRYALLRRQIHDKLRTPAGKQNNKLEILAEITRLRRFCCHPRLVFPEAPDESAKLRSLIPLVEELVENGHRALIFSQYVDFLSSVRTRLAEQTIEHEYLDGSSSQAARQSSIDRFNTGASPLFLISLKAGGVGLNLTAADYVIHLDPWWNPAVSSQATDRAHRIGQERPVTVLEFVTRDTIEEDILRLHQSKQELSRVVLDEAAQVAHLDPQDLRDWLSAALAERGASGLTLDA